MRTRSLFYSFLLFFLLFRLSVAEEKWPEFNLLKADPAQWPKPATVKVSHDTVYNVAKEYQAYPLAEILKKIPASAALKTEDKLIVFTAIDGYKVSMAYQDAIREAGYIAFKDNAATGNKSWIDFKFGKQMITPAPYYLVWPKKGLDEWRYPWPFQLASIALQPAKAYFGAAAPSSEDSKVNDGFNLFSRYCIRCHSVNLSGGEVGPELNIPKNVTEYFQAGELAGFILNATAYRAGTKMPVFENELSKIDVQNIISYLIQMKSEKKD